MEPIKITIAHNLIELRKAKNLTQSELAEMFSYSDKSVSKWEHGETTPDIETLKQLCDFYGVTIDYLFSSGTKEEKKHFLKSRGQQANKNVITALSVSAIWILAIIVYIGTEVLMSLHYWMAYVWAVPVSCIVVAVFNFIWGKKRWRTLVVISLVWTLLAAIYLELGCDLPNGKGWTFWMLFLMGIPLTVAAALWGHIKTDPAQR